MKIPFVIACLLLAQPPTELQFRVDKGIELAAPLSAAQQKALPLGPLPADQGEAWLRLCLVDPQTNKHGPAMFGDYRHEKTELIFRPRFGLEPDRTYRAVFGPAEKPLATKDHRVPPRNGGAPTTVAKIYPTADVLPANHLKFYVDFSQPMRGGKEIFNQIEILDADGNAIPDVWLTDELWDESGQTLIIYIHPGRIKWGLVLREVLGPVLLPDRDYSFVVRGGMVDANGRTLGKDVVKKFRTTAEDRGRIELKDWTIETTPAGAVEARFPKSVDHKSLEKYLSVVDDKGEKVAGAIAIGKDEKSWTFTPNSPLVGQYRLNIDGKLEDVAGNTPLRPFDLDLLAVAPAEQKLELPIPSRK